MKIQDFRIGNYISDDGDFATIELINGEMEEITYKGPKIYLTENLLYINPLDINEDSLTKIGFTKKFENKFNTSFMFNDIEYHIPKHGMNNSFLFYKRISFKIKYIHELQNIYYLIKGHEITID